MTQTLAQTTLPIKTAQDLIAEAKAQIQEIPPAKLKELLAQPEKITLIDVREPDETQAGTIERARTIPRGILELKIETEQPDRAQPIVVYCAGGGRSALAAQALQQMGYLQVYSLSGGYRGWCQ